MWVGFKFTYRKSRITGRLGLSQAVLRSVIRFGHSDIQIFIILLLFLSSTMFSTRYATVHSVSLVVRQSVTPMDDQSVSQSDGQVDNPGERQIISWSATMLEIS